MDSVILQASLALFSAAVAAAFAVQTYFQQREHELILARYLEGGIDLLAAELQRVITTFNHNWARCLSILAAFRDQKADFDATELQKGFMALESSNPNIIAHRRLFTLVGTHEYWMAYQSATAFFAGANAVVVNQIPDAIRLKLTTDRISAPYDEIASTGFEEARLQQDRSHRYVGLLTEFQNLSAELEAQRFRFKKLQKFKKRKEVRDSISRLNQTFGDEVRVKPGDAQPAVPADRGYGRRSR